MLFRTSTIVVDVCSSMERSNAANSANPCLRRVDAMSRRANRSTSLLELETRPESWHGHLIRLILTRPAPDRRVVSRTVVTGRQPLRRASGQSVERFAAGYPLDATQARDFAEFARSISPSTSRRRRRCRRAKSIAATDTTLAQLDCCGAGQARAEPGQSRRSCRRAIDFFGELTVRPGAISRAGRTVPAARGGLKRARRTSVPTRARSAVTGRTTPQAGAARAARSGCGRPRGRAPATRGVRASARARLRGTARRRVAAAADAIAVAAMCGLGGAAGAGLLAQLGGGGPLVASAIVACWDLRRGPRVPISEQLTSRDEATVRAALRALAASAPRARRPRRSHIRSGGASSRAARSALALSAAHTTLQVRDC